MESASNAGVGVARARSRVTDPLQDFSELVACVLPHLDNGRVHSCELVRWYKRRREKLVVEIKTTAPDGNGHAPTRCIVKMHGSDRTIGSYEALSRLWEAGFRPPSPYTVPRPVAYIADRGLLVQEKAPGAPLLDIILRGGHDATDAVVRAVGWLAALHTSAVEAAPRRAKLLSAVTRYAKELAAILPLQASRITRLAASALEQIESSDQSVSVPSHGDFHPKNIFITPTGQVTAIDFDTFGRQAAAADVAYFLAQTAIMGFFHRGSFAATSAIRECFLRTYGVAVSPLPRSRLALYLGMAFLQSLHYELCVFHTNNVAIVEPWLSNCARSLLDGDVMLI